MSITLPTPIATFLKEHDDLPAFHAGYILFAFLAASLLSTGLFLLLTVIHFAFDLVKYQQTYRFGFKNALIAATREGMADAALILLCLTFAIYFHHSLEFIAMLSGLLHAEMTVVKGLGTVLSRMAIGRHFIDAFALGHHRFLTKKGVHQKFKISEWVSVIGIGFTLLLLIGAPVIISMPYGLEWEIVVEHLAFWRY